ncbi:MULTISPECIES: cytidylyltransferase domain-containing protein [Clostridium]|nr:MULTISPECIES: acylneuraminate cytidylyltransferase family protein [Clostridium]MBE6044613.1 acylneuraminate cytidylyltransferase family protein [Clostridium thermopalmarium]
MYKNKRILAVIPARGGSKGIPHKNIINFCGKPLIAYSIEAAKKSKYIDYILVSTDDREIQGVSLRYGAKAPFLRPKEISDDKSKSIDVVLHSINYLKDNDEIFDYVILLQPTSPLRTEKDIDAAIETIIEKEGRSLVSLCKVDENPILMRTIEYGKLKPILKFDGDNLRRQDLPEFYIFNGAIYINTVDMLIENRTFVDEHTIPYIMERHKSVDIDNMLDVKIAEYILEENMDD